MADLKLLREAENVVASLKRAINNAHRERILGPVEIDGDHKTLKMETGKLEDEIRLRRDSAARSSTLPRKKWIGLFLSSPNDEVDRQLKIRGNQIEKMLTETLSTREAHPSVTKFALNGELPEASSSPDVRKVTTIGQAEEPCVGNLSSGECSDYINKPLFFFGDDPRDERYVLFSELQRLCIVLIGLQKGNERYTNVAHELAEHMADTVGISAHLARLNIDIGPLVQCAANAIDKFHSIYGVRGGGGGPNLEVITPYIRLWESHNERYYMLCLKQFHVSPNPADDAPPEGLENALLEEYKEWNSLENNDDLLKSLPTASPEGEPVELKVASHLFDYQIISNKFETALQQKILFEGMDNVKTVTFLVEGGFANIYIVELHDALEVKASHIAPEYSKLNKVVVKVARVESNHTVNAICVRVAREVRVWSKMKHENILPLLGLWKNFIVAKSHVQYSIPVTPYLEEGDLCQYMQNHSLTQMDQLIFLRDIITALEYMHGNEPVVVHGDLRANNVLVRNNRAYLCDFGLSHLIDEIYGFTTKPHGNDRWLAPEHLAKRSKPTTEGDIYSYGSVMLEVLSGEVPWSSFANNLTLTLHRAGNRQDTAPRPAEIRDDNHWNVIQDCWKFSPELRPPAKLVRRSIDQLIKRVALPAHSLLPSAKGGASTLVSDT